MKYKRLTKEQLEELNQEFVQFLAVQSIDKKEWDRIKLMDSEKAEKQIDDFSDFIWEATLTNAKYLEHYSKDYLVLINSERSELLSIIIHSKNDEIDLSTQEGLLWLEDHLFSKHVEIQKGCKKVGNKKNDAVFELILQGAIFSDGSIYRQMEEVLN